MIEVEEGQCTILTLPKGVGPQIYLYNNMNYRHSTTHFLRGDRWLITWPYSSGSPNPDERVVELGVNGLQVLHGELLLEDLLVEGHAESVVNELVVKQCLQGAKGQWVKPLRHQTRHTFGTQTTNKQGQLDN